MTIVMNGAGNLSTKEISDKFVKALVVGCQVSIRNGNMTIRLSYSGPLENVTKLIDFGNVASTDEQARKIVLEPK